MATVLVLALAVVSLLQQDRIGRWRIAWGELRRVLDLQHQCATWSLPRGTVVVEPDPLLARQLEGRNQFRPILIPTTARSDGLGPQFGLGAARAEFKWFAYQHAVLPRTERSRQAGGVVFAHRRLTPSGQRERIVVVEYFGEGSSVLWSTVIEPGSWTGKSPRCLRLDNEGDDRIKRSLWIGEPGVRLFAGRPDPADRSRFSVDYEVGSTRGTLRAQLRDDETVVLAPSTGTVALYNRNRYWFPTPQPATSAVSGARVRTDGR